MTLDDMDKNDRKILTKIFANACDFYKIMEIIRKDHEDRIISAMMAKRQRDHDANIKHTTLAEYIKAIREAQSEK